MLPHAFFLFHQGSGNFSGSYQEINSAVEEYQQQVEELSMQMLKHTKYTQDEVLEKIVGEWYIRKEEAVEKGVCDRVIESLDEIN